MTRLLTFLTLPCLVAAFAPQRPAFRQPSTTSLQALDPASALNSLVVATIDSDIASIPDNEFTTVFLGGIGVMAGGLLSAVIVGTILESKNLYANVVADSYAQGGDNEQFWRGLSDEEKVKAQEMLSKVKKSMDGELSPEANVMASEGTAEPAVPAPKAPKPKEASKPKEVDMFSDYGD